MQTLKGKASLRQVLLTVDMGGSKNKAIVQEYPAGRMEVLLLDPEVADISQASVDHIEACGKLESRVWVQTEDGYYALGELARRRFGGILQLKELKYELAVQKVCGLAWLAKEKLNLSRDTEIFLSILLPAGEVRDKDQLKIKVSKTLRGFGTPSGKMRLKLLYCDFASEGSGIYFHHQKHKADFLSTAFMYVMLGYRNASTFLIRSGVISPGITSNFGMAWLVNNFVSKVSGLSADNPKLVEAIFQAGDSCEPLILQKLSRKRKATEVEADGILMSQALLLAREEYVRAITRWLRANMEEDVDELVVCGGTADYLRAEIDKYFKNIYKFDVSWHGNISIPDGIAPTEMNNRLADVYGLHQHIVEKIDSKTGYERPAKLIVLNQLSNDGGVGAKEFAQGYDYTPRPRPKNFVEVNENL